MYHRASLHVTLIYKRHSISSLTLKVCVYMDDEMETIILHIRYNEYVCNHNDIYKNTRSQKPITMINFRAFASVTTVSIDGWQPDSGREFDPLINGQG